MMLAPKTDFHTRHMVETIDQLTRWICARLNVISQDQDAPSNLAKAGQLRQQLEALSVARGKVIEATHTGDR